MQRLEQYCKRLKLGAEIIESIDTIEYKSNREFLEKALEVCVDAQEVRKKNALIKSARFDLIKTFNQFSFTDIGIPETLTEEDIRGATFIENKQNLICYGSVGTGKTHLATAIGVEACKQGKKVRFYKVATLINELLEANETFQLGKYIRNLKQYELLILDELGYIPIGEKGAELFFQVIAECYEKKSLIITTNIEFSRWASIFMDKKITAAILDRIIHHGHLLIFSGESYRIKNSISRGR